MSLVQVARGQDLLRRSLERHVVNANTVAYWPLKESLADLGVNGLDMDENGTIQYLGVGSPETLSEVSAADVNNTNYGDRPSNDPELTILGELTIECMVYPTAFTGFGTICTMTASGESEPTNYPFLFRFNSSGQVAYFAERGGSGTDIVFTGTNGIAMATYRWHHVAMTRTASGEIETYLNGALTGRSSGLLSPTGGGSTFFRIGGYPGGNDLEGYLSDLIIYNNQRTAAEIRADAERMLPTWDDQNISVKLSEHQPEAATVGLWQCNGDELEATGAFDRLTEVGNFQYEDISPIERPMRPTITNYGYEPYDPALALTGAMTLMGLVKLDSIDSLSYIFGFGANDGVTEAGNFLYSVRYDNTGQLEYYAEQNASNGFTFLGNGGALTTGVWHHVAMTRTAGQIVRLFIDGVNVGTSVTLATPTGGTNSPFFIGAFATGDIEGSIRSVHLLNRQLSDAEVFAEASRLLADR